MYLQGSNLLSRYALTALPPSTLLKGYKGTFRAGLLDEIEDFGNYFGFCGLSISFSVFVNEKLDCDTEASIPRRIEAELCSSTNHTIIGRNKVSRKQLFGMFALGFPVVGDLLCVSTDHDCFGLDVCKDCFVQFVSISPSAPTAQSKLRLSKVGLGLSKK